MFGKLIASVVEGVIDTVELTTSIATDVVKSPARTVDKLEGGGEEFLQDTKDKINEIKSK